MSRNLPQDHPIWQTLADIDAAESSDFRTLVTAANLDPTTDFQYVSLAGLSLAKQNLSNFDFTGADLRGTMLRRASSVTGLRISEETILDREDRKWLQRQPLMLSESWRRCCFRLREELGEDIFNSWFGRIELESIEGDRARLSVPTRFLKSWIDTHYVGHLTTALAAEVGPLARILVVVRSMGPELRPEAPLRGRAARAALARVGREDADATGEISSAAAQQNRSAAARRGILPRTSAAAAAVELPVASPLVRRLTFATFQVGRSNQLAFSAAQRVAEHSGGRTSAFRPLYLHSAVGLGKTHLLQAVAHTAASQGRSAIYLTAEKFMYGFIAALQSQTSIAFKERLRAIDVLIFDDAQFLQGKSIQAEFGHALNALLDAGRDVVVAADRPPNELEALDERIRSRLSAGLCVEIGPLNEALRLKILEARVAAVRALRPSFELSPAVLAFVADSIRSNGRDLEGAVNRLLAHTTLSGAPLTVKAAEVTIRDLIRAHEPKPVKIEDIQKLVAKHYGVSRADILSSRRTAVVVKPRQVAMVLAKTLTMRSLAEIGRRFGGRDHTSVLRAVRKMEALAASDTKLCEDIELLQRLLQPKRAKIEDIQELVANHYKVSRVDILSSRRTAVVVKSRQVAMFLAKTLTMRSLPEIGRRFGGRDNTTVLHAVRKIEALSANDFKLRADIELLTRMLQE
jgi:chromosomal replication initiator protein